MNKKNKILVGCLALLLALSIGYALFSETITINGTATAKGNFDITATCQAGFMDELVNTGMYTSEIQSQNNYSNESCRVDGNKVTFNTTLSQPGALRYFTVKMTNTGSIPAIIDGSKITDEYMLTNKTTKVCALLEDGTASTNCTEDLVYIDDDGYVGSDTFAPSNEFGVMIGGQYCDFWEDDCSSKLVAGALSTGDSAYYMIPLRWPEDYASGYEHGFQATITFEVPFSQQTAQ